MRTAAAALGAAVALATLATSCRHEDTRAAQLKPARAGLVFTRYASAGKPSVWLAEADGSHPRRVVAGAFRAKLSPDGRRFAYMVSAGNSDSTPILFVRAIASAKPRRVGRAFGYGWSPDGKRLAVQGTNSLVLFDIRSGATRTLVRGRIAGFSFAPTGDAIAYGRWNGRDGSDYRSEVFVIELESGRIRHLTHDRHSDDPVWGRSWIVYRRFHASGDSLIGRLRLRRPDGSGDYPLARGDERTSPPRLGLEPLELSRNGTVLLACAAAEFSCAPVVYLVPRGVGASFEAPIRRLRRAGELANASDLSRDGRRVLFTVGPFDTPVGDRVYAAGLDGGGPRLLVRNASEASWAG